MSNLAYIGSDGVFTQIGKLIKYYNDLETESTDLDQDMESIFDTFNLPAQSQNVALTGLVNAFEEWKAQNIERRATFAEFVLIRLRERTTVLELIGASSDDPDEIMRKLIRAMIEDTETVEKTVATVTPTEVTASLGNTTDDSQILLTTILDGVSSPGISHGIEMPAMLEHENKKTELTVPDETMRFMVVADSYQDGLDAGAEQVIWEGDLPDVPHGFSKEGSGSIGTIQPIHASQLILNADFEEETSGNLDDWTVDNGTWNTDVFRDTTSFSHGGASLKLATDDVTDLKLSQVIAADTVVANRMYCLTARVKTSDEGVGIGTLKLQFEDDGGNQVGDDTVNNPGIETTHAGITDLAGWKLVHAFIRFDGCVPETLKFVIRWDADSSSSSSATADLFIDDIGFAPVNYGGGVGAVIVRGVNKELANGDGFSTVIGIDTNQIGVFQTFFRRIFGMQLPSAATPSITDTLAS